jgi:hypothetical protein
MRKGDFIGKLICEGKVGNIKGIEAKDEEEKSAHEIFLHDFPFEGWTDKAGFNAYSIVLAIADGRITDVQRIGHIHMKGGQGSDEELIIFPHRSLEREAQRAIEAFVA